MSRKMAAVEALRHDLKVRGLSSAQIELAQRGDFVTEITVFAPSGSDERIEGTAVNAASDLDKSYRSFGKVFEVQELSVELGEQVAMGANLCLIADLESLFVEGHAFKQDAHFLERAVQQDWPILIEFSESIDNRWPPLDQSFQIQHLANAVDPDSRTFAVLIPLTNQYRTYQKDGKEHVVWRFRPGERVRLHISVEELSDVFVLPAAGVARDGPEAYVFRQNGDLFNRLPVHVMCEDRVSVVVANDGDLRAGFYIAQNAAASLNRVLKAQAASGTPVGMHVHADGTIHGGH
jgi:hypothetical protein